MFLNVHPQDEFSPFTVSKAPLPEDMVRRGANREWADRQREKKAARAQAKQKYNDEV